ncbi:hypothetical protein EI427_14710 [Flammeovirga pectinis]|uniref:DUF6311 domain-containing protein n=1 Tax=Flammeovirga pectinis TaxID=2494373 RepID=A0A3S9P5D2_9BACT|nr:hypothetical protein [Flammeovirga pectinis]AZQ63436.1 hypothetical protein EI427_14710 [Flammeovirga pectinis]
MSTEIDALKNYFFYVWIVRYGPETKLLANNYPFGESILYTDSMPIISSILYYFLKIINIKSVYSIGILHYILFSLYGFSYSITYKILNQLRGNKHWVNVFASILITLILPSNSRISLHFGLFFLLILIPLLIYCLIKVEKGNSFILTLLLPIILFGFLIHSYSGFFLGYISILFFIIKLIIVKPKKRNLIGLLLTIAVILFYLLLLKNNDQNLWRSSHPLFMYDFRLSVKQILFPFYDSNYHSYYRVVLNYWFWISVFLCLLKFKSINIKNNKNLITFFIIGFLSIMYGTSIFLRFEFLYKVFPILEQVRSLERFGWVANYLLSISIFIILSKIYNSRIIILIITLGILESFLFHTDIQKDFTYTSNPYTKETVEGSLNINCIFPIYSNKNDCNKKILQDTYSLAYYLKTPTIHNYLSRRSDEEKNIHDQFILPSVSNKSIQKYYPINDRILLHGNIENLNFPKNFINGIKTIRVSSNYFQDNIIQKDTLIKYSKKNYVDSIFNIKNLGTQKILNIKTHSLKLNTTYSLMIWNYNYHQDSLILNKLELYQGQKLIGSQKNFTSYSIMDNHWGGLKINFKLLNNKPLHLNVKSIRRNYIFLYNYIFDIPTELRARKQPLIFKNIMIFEKDSLDKLLKLKND